MMDGKHILVADKLMKQVLKATESLTIKPKSFALIVKPFSKERMVIELCFQFDSANTGVVIQKGKLISLIRSIEQYFSMHDIHCSFLHSWSSFQVYMSDFGTRIPQHYKIEAMYDDKNSKYIVI